MRKVSHELPDGSSGNPRAEEWWDALDLSQRIAYEMSEVLAILGRIGVQLRTNEGRPLRWMEKSIACAFADADRILQELEQ